MVQGRKWRWVIAVVATLSLSGLAQAKAPQVEFVPGEYVVKLKDGISALSQKNIGMQLRAEVKRAITKTGDTLLITRSMIEKSDFVISSLSQNPMVEYIEPNYIYRANLTPNDPKLSELWGMINTGQNLGKTVGKENIDIDADRAWDLSTGSKDIVVAVIDTGVDYGIDDLAPNMWVNQAEKDGLPNVDDDGNGYIDDVYGYDFANKDGDPRDDHGHGSHCAGTIGAKGDDGIGVVGVNWNVSIMGIKFLSASGSGTLADAVSSIDYATVNGVDVMSNSWGGGGFSQALEDAIVRAKDAGIIFIAAAGNHSANNDENPTYPANYEVDNVLSVAAINSSGDLAGFSCYGKTTVHVGAPGVGILSTTPNGYKSWSGTSMATPHVAGVAALLLSHERELDYKEVKERLITTARPISGLRGRVASGLVNAYNALSNTLPEADPDDPYHWESMEFSMSSAHPYKAKDEQTWTVKVPGASRISIYFDRFQTEKNYDKVFFKNTAGEVVGIWSGSRDGSHSPVIEGDTATITLISDGSVQKYGFDITAVAFK